MYFHELFHVFPINVHINIYIFLEWLLNSIIFVLLNFSESLLALNHIFSLSISNVIVSMRSLREKSYF